MDNGAPALSRGIELIRLLAERGESTLEELARLSGHPKSSLLRILEVLCNEGVAQRIMPQKQYRLLQNLVAVSEGDFPQRLDSLLADLAETSGQTAEWYMPFNEGMTLVARREATQAETGVMARIGFVRAWLGELDSVNLLGTAFFRNTQDIPTRPAYTFHKEPRKLSPLPRTAALEMIGQVKADRCAMDNEINSNSVRRVATVLMREGKPYGVIALAQVAYDSDCASAQSLRELLLRLSAPLRK